MTIACVVELSNDEAGQPIRSVLFSRDPIGRVEWTYEGCRFVFEVCKSMISSRGCGPVTKPNRMPDDEPFLIVSTGSVVVRVLA